MLSWYSYVFGARVQHKNPAMAFLTFDDEHHRFAFLDLSAIDPDGNQMEFQVNAFDTDEECNAYICGPDFEANPVGVEFDREEWLAAVRDGASLEDFRIRKIHEPVSPIRGEISALL